MRIYFINKTSNCVREYIISNNNKEKIHILWTLNMTHLFFTNTCLIAIIKTICHETNNRPQYSGHKPRNAPPHHESIQFTIYHFSLIFFPYISPTHRAQTKELCVYKRKLYNFKRNAFRAHFDRLSRIHENICMYEVRMQHCKWKQETLDSDFFLCGDCD